MFKKLLNLAVLTAMMATLIPMTAFAATGVTINPLTTTDTTPTLTGTMTASVDGDAVTVTVNGQTYNAVENYVNGTWTADVTTALAVGTYNVVAIVANIQGGTFEDATVNELTITAPQNLTISSFTVSPETGFDPSSDGENEDLAIAYSISEAPTSVTVEIVDANLDNVKSFTSTSQATSFSWDGTYSSELVEPGTYTVVLVAKKTGYVDATQQKTVVVEYNDSDKPALSNFSVDPTSFDLDDDEAVIEFTNDDEADITVEVRDSFGNKVRGFDKYENDNFDADEDHKINWDGLNDSDNEVNTGTYKVVVIARNDSGVSVKQENVEITNNGSSDSPSNAHISGIKFSPSSNFKPAEDDELQIEFDVLKDLDDLTVYAKKGSEEIELYDDSSLDQDNNLEITWDGTDEDGDYVVSGLWKIEFRSEEGATSLVANKSIKVSYDKANIDNIYVSKDKFDNDLGEFTYVMFRVDTDCLVDVNILLEGDEDDTIEEDIEVSKDGWYAVQFDADGYDYGDDLEIEVVAKNEASEDEDDSAKIDIDLAEDDVSSSSKSNVTNDYMEPVLTDGKSEMSLSYELGSKADVTITIHKGKSSTGTKMIELLDVKNQADGEHTITWDGRDDDGDKLADGVYTYKIISKKSSTDTEVGYFVVGDVEDAGSSSDSNDDDEDNNDKISSNVVVDGKITNTGKTSTTTTGRCSNFSDVLAGSPDCEAIIWATNAGIFQGYLDGTFKPYQTINRAQMLKVALLATGTTVNLWDYSTVGLGFTDLTTGAWYIPFIKGAKLVGIFSGDGGANTARPTAAINRAEVLKFVFESLKVSKNYQLGYCSSSFTDVLPTNWYFQYACSAKTYSLFTSGTVLNPDLPATRSEVASVLYKLHTAGLL
ncbi:MAG: FlgD immunoglobulin-like domain containing protein [Candidatus Gracilibacteria bacterium]